LGWGVADMGGQMRSLGEKVKRGEGGDRKLGGVGGKKGKGRGEEGGRG